MNCQRRPRGPRRRGGHSWRPRPIASGALPQGVAAVAAALLCAAALFGGLLLDKSVALVLAVYLLVNLAFSRVLKHVVIIDVMTLVALGVQRERRGARCAIMPPIMASTETGENKAWELLAAADPGQVCERAGVRRDVDRGGFLVPSFHRSFLVLPAERLVLGLEPEGELFLERQAPFFRLSVLWYLVKAAPLRPAGSLVRPAGLPGGGIFVKGTHVLPLDALAAKYGRWPEVFVAAGAALGGVPVSLGSAAVVLKPLPKVPTTVLLWTEDDEYPARADLLFDATAPLHLPTDILWSLAMLTILSFP